MDAARVKSLLKGLRVLHTERYVGLAGSIILKALLDYHGHGKVGARYFAKQQGFSSVPEEVEAFWEGDWGLWLREAYGLEHIGLCDLREEE